MTLSNATNFEELLAEFESQRVSPTKKELTFSNATNLDELLEVVKSERVSSTKNEIKVVPPINESRYKSILTPVPPINESRYKSIFTPVAPTNETTVVSPINWNIYKSGHTPRVNSSVTGVPYNYQSNVGKYIDKKSINFNSIAKQRENYTNACICLAMRTDLSREERDKYMNKAECSVQRAEELYEKDNKATEAEMKRDRRHAKFETIFGGCVMAGSLLYALKSAHDDYEDGSF